MASTWETWVCNNVTIVAWANLAPSSGDAAFTGALVNTIYATPTKSATA